MNNKLSKKTMAKAISALKKTQFASPLFSPNTLLVPPSQYFAAHKHLNTIPPEITESEAFKVMKNRVLQTGEHEDFVVYNDEYKMKWNVCILSTKDIPMMSLLALKGVDMNKTNVLIERNDNEEPKYYFKV